MALPTVETLLRAAARTGHAADIIEKVARLLDMLKEINGDPALAGRLALKGGTALNVFHLNLDRLSVDIDFNYVGALDREAMMNDRPGIEAAIDRLLFSGGYSVRRRPEAHGGGKWVARYASALGGNAVLELDVNYMERQPLFGSARMASKSFAGFGAGGILVLDIHEIAAGKIVALLSRRTFRDLFDARRILSIEGIDWSRVKLAVMALGVCSRMDWREVSTGDIRMPADSPGNLLNCLPEHHFLKTIDLGAWIEETISLCREHCASLFRFSPGERTFLDRILDHGEIRTELLEDAGPEVRERIASMPMLA